MEEEDKSVTETLAPVHYKAQKDHDHQMDIKKELETFDESESDIA